MYFTACANLAERHPGLAGVIQQIDAQLQDIGTAEVLRVGDFASFLGIDPNQVTSVFEMLAEDGFLVGEEMVECPHCRTAVLRSEYDLALEEEGEFRCTDCDRPLPNGSVRKIITYRRGERWRELPKATDQGPFYLAVVIKETVFDAETQSASLESASEESQEYFYRVEDRELALQLLALFDKKLGENSAGIGKTTRVQFALTAASDMDNAGRFLTDEAIGKLATEVSGYAAQWTVDCLELGEPPWVYDPYNPPLYKEDEPLSAASLHHRAEQWKDSLTPKEDVDALQEVFSTEGISGLADHYAQDDRVLQKRGATWLAVYEGVPKSIPDSNGVAYIAYLLRQPGREVHAAKLRADIQGKGQNIVAGSAGEILDDDALKDYKERITEIDEELAEAEANNDLARKGQLAEEREALCDEIRSATGLGGKKRTASDDRERHRQAVSRAIHRALRRIKDNHEPLWQHLQNSLKIGEFLSYQPDQPTSWTT